MLSYPIFYQEFNFIWNTSRQCWAWYELEPFSYDHRNHDDKVKCLAQLSRLFYATDFPGHLLMVPVPYDIAGHQRMLREDAPAIHAAIAKWHSEGTEEHVTRFLGEGGYQYRFFVGYQLPRPTDLVEKRSLLQAHDFLARTKRFFLEWAGLEDPVLWEYELRAYRTEETNLYGRLTSTMKLRRADQKAMEWLLRRPFWRGIQEPELHQGWTPGAIYESDADGAEIRVRPQKADILGLAEGLVDLSDPRRVAVTQDTCDGEETGYQSHLFLSELPDQFTFPGGTEWALDLQRMEYPVEVAIRWDVIPWTKALSLLRKKVLESDDQQRNMLEAGAKIPSSLRHAIEQQMLLEEDLRQRKFPTLNTSIQICVYSDDIRTLVERRQRVRDHFRAHYTATVEIPAGDQWLAAQQMMPGTPRYLADYIHRLPPDVVAGAMFGATDQLGDNDGVLIGWTTLGRPVYLAPWLAPQRQKSASIAFLGTLGGGKSVTANLLAYLAVVYAGAKVLVLDPKGERTDWPKHLPELQGEIHVITLGTASADRGTLDPWGMAQASGIGGEWRKEAADLAVNVLTFLCNKEIGTSEHSFIMEAVDHVNTKLTPCMQGVIDYLQAHDKPEAQQLGQYFHNLSHRGLAGLMFGDGQTRTIDVTCSINILQLQNLQLPREGTDRRDWTTDNYLSMALMQCQTAFSNQFLKQGRGLFKIVLLDEAWALLTNSQGKAIAKHTLRTGRAMNAAIFLLAQNALDLDDDDAGILNNIGIKMAFRSKHRTELERLLHIYNLDSTESNMGQIRDLDSGWCFLQDLDGRCGRVRIDPVFEHLLEAFKTTPPDPTRAAAAS